MNCQHIFSGKNKKNIISLSSAELAQRMVKVKALVQTTTDNTLKYMFVLIFPIRLDNSHEMSSLIFSLKKPPKNKQYQF